MTSCLETPRYGVPCPVFPAKFSLQKPARSFFFPIQPTSERLSIKISTSSPITSRKLLKRFHKMQSLQDGINYVSGKASEVTSGVSKEGNKNVAKDSNQSLGTRASAAKDAAGDKASELKDSASSKVDEERLKH